MPAGTGSQHSGPPDEPTESARSAQPRRPRHRSRAIGADDEVPGCSKRVDSALGRCHLKGLVHQARLPQRHRPDPNAATARPASGQLPRGPTLRTGRALWIRVGNSANSTYRRGHTDTQQRLHVQKPGRQAPELIPIGLLDEFTAQFRRARERREVRTAMNRPDSVGARNLMPRAPEESGTRWSPRRARLGSGDPRRHPSAPQRSGELQRYEWRELPRPTETRSHRFQRGAQAACLLEMSSRLKAPTNYHSRSSSGPRPPSPGTANEEPAQRSTDRPPYGRGPHWIRH